MDFRRNSVLKEQYTFFVGDEHAQVEGGERGVYNRDTRVLSRYVWRWLPAAPGRMQTLVVDSPRPDTLHAHYALLDGDEQRLAVQRRLHAVADGLDDELVVENTSRERLSVSVDLEVASDFDDLFEVRGWHRIDRDAPHAEVTATTVRLTHRAGDGVECGVDLAFDALAAARPDGADWELSLAPRERVTLRAAVRVDNPLDEPPHRPIGYDAWRSAFSALFSSDASGRAGRAALHRAVDDLRGLLLFTRDGPVPAAGIPWFVAAFGRDSLLTAHLLLPYAPEVAEGTLRYLARHQGTRFDAFRGEQPGKIMHELRFGELTRTGVAPHGPYYGTIDATPLFVTLLDAHHQATGRLDLVTALRPAWEAALTWIVEHGDVDGDGFVEFAPPPAARPGVGLAVQSWKDSSDSMSHADGSLATGAVAVSEVQGYAFAAFTAAARFYRALGESAAAATWEERAAAFAQRFDEAFWLDDLGTYALALDGDKRPLRVLASDAGHLLWSGVVPEAHAPRLVETLLSPPLWSGWGIRTLGAGEVRYNPVSYHNGSVWPHDNAIIALGLARYGFAEAAETVRRAIMELAEAQHDLRLPELVAGYARDERPPVPYPVACRPQAWDAAALVALAVMTPGAPAAP
jgi:glycogen debranching enzyme